MHFSRSGRKYSTPYDTWTVWRRRKWRGRKRMAKKKEMRRKEVHLKWWQHLMTASWCGLPFLMKLSTDLVAVSWWAFKLTFCTEDNFITNKMLLLEITLNCTLRPPGTSPLGRVFFYTQIYSLWMEIHSGIVRFNLIRNFCVLLSLRLDVLCLFVFCVQFNFGYFVEMSMVAGQPNDIWNGCLSQFVDWFKKKKIFGGLILLLSLLMTGGSQFSFASATQTLTFCTYTMRKSQRKLNLFAKSEK